MGQTLNELRKIQESRQNYQGTTVARAALLANTTQAWPKTALMAIAAAGAAVAILISIFAIMLIRTNLEAEQFKIRILENTIKIQEIKINGLATSLNKTGWHSDSEIRDLDLRFKKEDLNMKDQINSLALAFKDTYKFMLSRKF